MHYVRLTQDQVPEASQLEMRVVNEDLTRMMSRSNSKV